jgi:hypothetical protein
MKNENSIPRASAVLAIVSGDTRQHAEALKSKSGYRWNPAEKVWWRAVDSAKVDAIAAQTTHPFAGCRRIVVRYDAAGMGTMIADIDLRAESSREHVGNCAACGSYETLHPSPRGLVCADCRG